MNDKIKYILLLILFIIIFIFLFNLIRPDEMADTLYNASLTRSKYYECDELENYCDIINCKLELKEELNINIVSSLLIIKEKECNNVVTKE